MRTKPVSRLLALAVVLMMIPAFSALAESCILCGRDSGSDAYLCANCLLDMMAEKDISGGLEITGVETNADGSVTLRWADAAANAPYSVYYELLERAPVPFGWTAAEGTDANALLLTQLAPGVSYVFTVVDAAGNKVETVYYAPAVENGNEIGLKTHIHTRHRYGEKVLNRPFSVTEIQQRSTEHGLALKMNYSMLKKTRNYAFCVTVEAPNGFADVVYSGQLTLNYGKSEVPAWGFIELDDYFACLERYYGGVPTGEYLVTLYFDGKTVYTVSFDVAE